MKLEPGFVAAAQIQDLLCTLVLPFLHAVLSGSSSGLSLSTHMVHD